MKNNEIEYGGRHTKIIQAYNNGIKILESFISCEKKGKKHNFKQTDMKKIKVCRNCGKIIY